MLCFPQLTTGAISQYPIVKQVVTRTVANQLEDGSMVRMSDEGAAQIAWNLTFGGLSNDEWRLIEELFESVQGGLGTFTFLDPASNLLSWSEDYSQSVWIVDPMIVLSAAVPDPLGGAAATSLTNTAQARQKISQGISGPASFEYCFSIYLRSDSPQTVTMMQSSTNAAAERLCAVSTQWTRFALSANLKAADVGVAFGISLEPGANVQVFGPQVEPQPAAGKYKTVLDRSGVYTNCRFATDLLTISADTPNQNSGTVQLVCNPTSV